MDSCAISVYKLSRNKRDIVFIFRLFSRVKSVVSYSIHFEKPLLCVAATVVR